MGSLVASERKPPSEIMSQTVTLLTCTVGQWPSREEWSSLDGVCFNQGDGSLHSFHLFYYRAALKM